MGKPIWIYFLYLVFSRMKKEKIKYLEACSTVKRKNEKGVLLLMHCLRVSIKKKKLYKAKVRNFKQCSLFSHLPPPKSYYYLLRQVVWVITIRHQQSRFKECQKILYFCLGHFTKSRSAIVWYQLTIFIFA